MERDTLKYICSIQIYFFIKIVLKLNFADYLLPSMFHVPLLLGGGVFCTIRSVSKSICLIRRNMFIGLLMNFLGSNKPSFVSSVKRFNVLHKYKC
jgi:hypothetical protein